MWGNLYEPYYKKDNYIPIEMTVEDIDKVLNEQEILYITRKTRLIDVIEIKVPCKNYTVINAGDLSQCINLRELDLSENLIKDFPRNLNLPNLKFLDIAGNRLCQMPLIEQFPNIIVANVDHNTKLNMDAQAIAYFCPNLKIINGEYFEESVGDQFVEHINNTSRLLETNIRWTWENKFSENCENITNNVQRRYFINEMINQWNGEHLSNFTDLLIYILTEKYLLSKVNDIEDELLASASSPVKKSNGFYGVLKDCEQEDEKLLMRYIDINQNEMNDMLEITNELIGNNMDTTSNHIVLTTTGPDGLQQQFLVEQQNNTFHIAQSLMRKKSVAFTVFNPKMVKVRPTAEFLPGELRNKDYVKGDMASDIYQKAVKEVLGQRGLSKNNAMPQVNNNNLKKRGRPAKPLGETIKHEAPEAPLIENKIPPRPKMRKRNGELRSLKDLNKANGCISNQLDYDPSNFIRCHAKDAASNDQEIKVWRCAFEPNIKVPGGTTHRVATCGGEFVCIIDCDIGKVIHRYMREGEEFIALAWTTLEIEPENHINVLASGGKSKEIRLFFSDRQSCMDLKGHEEDVSSLIFHTSVPQILFSGDARATIIVWDIGIPPKDKNILAQYKLLNRLRCPRLDFNPVMNLVFLDHYSYLIAGCDDAMFAWKITDFKINKKEREPDMELKFTDSNKIGILTEDISYDGLAQIGRTALVFRVVNNPSLFVFDFGNTLERRKGLQKTIPIEVCGTLNWILTSDFYININSRNNLGAVLCGDSEGKIWIYDLDPYIEENPERITKGFNCPAFRVLLYPECNEQVEENNRKPPVINTVDMSSDGLFVVGVTDNNLACIWKLTKDEIPN